MKNNKFISPIASRADKSNRLDMLVEDSTLAVAGDAEKLCRILVRRFQRSLTFPNVMIRRPTKS